MKKLIVGILIVFMFFSLNIVYATQEKKDTLTGETATNVLEMKNDTDKKIQKYTEKYGSETYGKTAFVLNAIRIYSIPVGFAGIIMGALFQYVLGTRRLDKKHKGFNLIFMFVTLMVICQVLPLIYAIVVTNWGF